MLVQYQKDTVRACIHVNKNQKISSRTALYWSKFHIYPAEGRKLILLRPIVLWPISIQFWRHTAARHEWKEDLFPYTIAVVLQVVLSLPMTVISNEQLFQFISVVAGQLLGLRDFLSLYSKIAATITMAIIIMIEMVGCLEVAKNLQLTSITCIFIFPASPLFRKFDYCSTVSGIFNMLLAYLKNFRKFYSICMPQHSTAPQCSHHSTELCQRIVILMFVRNNG